MFVKNSYTQCHVSVVSHAWQIKVGGLEVQGQPVNVVRSCLEIKFLIKAVGVVQ